MVAALHCVWPEFQWYQLAYATEMKSIQLHDSIVMALPWDSMQLHYITQYITMGGSGLPTLRFRPLLRSVQNCWKFFCRYRGGGPCVQCSMCGMVMPSGIVNPHILIDHSGFTTKRALRAYIVTLCSKFCWILPLQWSWFVFTHNREHLCSPSMNIHPWFHYISNFHGIPEKNAKMQKNLSFMLNWRKKLACSDCSQITQTNWMKN